jgi:hypothetical protein
MTALRISRPRQSLPELPLPQQAGIVCGDRRFWRFLLERKGELVIDADQAARAVRDLCGVGSRRDFVPGTAPGEAWAELLADFQIWSRQ